MTCRAFVIAAAALLVTGGSPPQSRAERDGRAILGRAHDALGGRLAAMPRNWMVEGHGRENLSAELQGVTAGQPTWRPHEERVGVSLATESAGWERRTPRNDDSLRHRRFVYHPNETIVLDHANNFGRATPGDVPAERRRALMRRIPHLFVWDLASRNASSVRKTRDVRIDGARADEIRVDLPGGETFLLAIGRSPAILLAASYEIYFPGKGPTKIEWRWTEWRQHARVGHVPGGHRIIIDGVPFQDVTYTRFDADASDIDAFLRPALPAMRMADVPAWAAPAGPATGEIAPGVHVARIGGFTVLFAEVDGGVVVFEAPEPFFGTESIPASNHAAAGTLSPQVLAEARKRFPAIPIRHVVISHHHGDHMGGLRVFTDAGAEALIAREDLSAARRAIDEPLRVAGTARAASPRLRPVAGVETIGEGSRQIQIMNVGPNPHTAGNLVLWMPRQGILIQGDLFYADAGSGFHAGRERMNRFFATWLRDRGIRPRLMYGVHNNGAVGPEALDAALR